MPPIHAIASSAPDSALSHGYIMGTLLGVVIPAVFLVRLRGQFRLPEYSKRGVVGRMCFQGGWLLQSLLGSASLLVPNQSAPILIAARILMLAPVVGLFMAGGVLSLLGTIDTYRSPERYSRGRKRCISVCALVLLGGSLAIAGAVAGALAARGDTRPWEPGSVAVEEYRFRIAPPEGWEQRDPKELDASQAKDATPSRGRVLFGKKNSQMRTVVLAEPLPEGNRHTLQDEAKGVRANIYRLQAGDVLGEQPLRVNSMDGVRVDAKFMGAPFTLYCSETWATIQKGARYSVVTWGPLSERAQIQADAALFRSTFHLLQTPPPGLSLAVGQRYRSPQFGFSADLSGTGWTQPFPASARAKSVPMAEWAVLSGDGKSAFFIIPVGLGRQDAELDPMVFALLRTLNFSMEGKNTSEKPFEQGALSGRDLTWRGPRDGSDSLLRARILSSAHASYLLAAWTHKLDPPGPEQLERALNAVRFESANPPAWDALNDEEKARHQYILNSIGLFFLDQKRQPAESLSWFQRAVERGRPEPAFLFNLVKALGVMGKADEALETLAKAGEELNEHPLICLTRASLELAKGDWTAASTSFEKGFSKGFRDDDQFEFWIRALCERGETEHALNALENYAKGQDSARLRRLRATILCARKDFDSALAVLEALCKDDPGSEANLVALAEGYFAAERFSECAVQCERLLAQGHELAPVYFRKGLCELALKRYRNAKASFEKAHQKEPGEPNIKKLLDQTNAMLGQGDNLTVKKPLAEVEVPADQLIPADPATAADYLQGYNAYYRLCHRAIVYQKGRELRSTERHVVTVLDAPAVESFSTLSFPFDPLQEEIFVNALSVRNAEGELIASASMEQSYVLDEGGSDLVSQRKILHVPVPGLQPGSTLHYTLTRRDVDAPDAFEFRSFTFSRGLPVLRSVVQLKAPTKNIRWETTPDVPAPLQDPSSKTLRWHFEKPPVYRSEPLQADTEHCLPLLWMAESTGSWKAEAQNYLKLIKDRTPIDPAVREAAKKAVAGLSEPGEKIAALSRLVQRDLTYKGLEFGRRARVPAPAAETLRNRYGDCKDHSLLLWQLLEASGVDARLALVSTAADVRPQLPSLDQFNHMIVYLPFTDGGRFVDCTSKSANLRDKLPPHSLATHHALVLDPEKPGLVAIPDYPDTAARVSSQRHLTVEENGDLSVRESVTFEGYIAASLREHLERIQPAQRQSALQTMLHDKAPSLELQSAEVAGVDSPEKPLRIELRYLLRQRFQTVGNQLIGQIPAIWERAFFVPEPVEKRQSPFHLRMPLGMECHVEIHSAAGWKPSLSKGTEHKDAFSQAQPIARIDAQNLLLDCRLLRQRGEFPATRYSAFQSSCAAALSRAEQTIVFEKPH